MIHTALARKYRPRRFRDLVAQPHVAAGLGGAVARNRVAHAYLLTGPRGVGKTTAARILAMALNCEAREESGEPCGSCESCRRIWAGGANLDVVEIDAASNRGVDDARDLRERAMYAASGPERFKVYIVDEAHMLTREAWNVLLKILEEPPPRVVFVFTTTEPQKIANMAAPVLSRLQRFDFRRVGPQAIAGRLREVAEAESVTVENDALTLIARVAAGGLRDALSLLDQAVAFGDGPVTADRVREALGLIDDELFVEMLDIVAGQRAADVFPFVGRIVESGADLAELVAGAGEVLRGLVLQIMGGESEGMTEHLRAALERHAQGFRVGDILRMLKLLADAETAVRRSPNARLHVETLLLEWTLLDRTVELGDVLAALQSGSARARTEAAPSAPRSTTRGNPPPPPPPPPPPAPSPGSHAPAPDPSRATGEWTVETVRRDWPRLLEAVGARRRVLKEALAHASPAAVDGDVVTLAVSDSEVYLESLERGRGSIEEAAAAIYGREVRLSYRPAEAQTPDVGARAPNRRLDRDRDREERLRHYREKDPALDAAADALDLELLE